MRILGFYPDHFAGAIRVKQGECLVLLQFVGAAIGVGLGLFTRLAAIGSALYVFIATVMGAHFTLGFIWANPGGGWEYPVLWTVLLLSFCYAGAGAFSIDGVLRRHAQLPDWMEFLMVRRELAAHEHAGMV